MADWESLGGGLTSAPAIASWAKGRLDVFGRGTDNALWHKSLADGAWSEWKSLRGILTSPPAAVSWGEGRIDVFVRGTDRALWHRWFTGGRWRGWESLGGILNFGPTVASWGPRRLDVFARGTDNTIFQRTFNGSWKPWQRIGEPHNTAALPGIAAVSSAEGKIDIVAWGANKFLVHKSFRDGEWKFPQTIGNPGAGPSTGTSLAVASWREDRLDIFMRGPDNTLFHKAGVIGDDGLMGVTTSDRSLGGILTSGPAAVASHSGRTIDVIVRGTDNAFWRMRAHSPTPA